ncbi:MAG: alginate export family protein [Candidatus Omnitrophica bacterium]|nr:alginate export family protein [Candidatus Omnitrophota bacterium]
MKRYLMGILILLLLGYISSYAGEVKIQDRSIKGGVILRIRHEYWKNLFDMNNASLDNRNFFRFRPSLWAQTDFNKNMSLYLRLTNEFRAHIYFGGRSGTFPDKNANKKGYHFDINEVFFDNLYLDLKNVLGLPLDLCIGRQDLLGYGEGFILMDGTPGDGGRSLYFNAAKATWWIDENNTLDLIYINNPRDEEFLPLINKFKFRDYRYPTRDPLLQNLSTTDEQGGVIYLKNKAIKNLNLEAYYVYKYEAEEGGVGAQAEKCKLNTIGSFVKYSLAPWAIRAQIAGQFGDYGNEDRTGLGAYAYLDREFKEAIYSPSATIGYIFLSGDKTTTSKNEGWDPIFSRWGWLSELYVYSMAIDTSISYYWTNLSVLRALLALKPTEASKLTLVYNHLWADEKTTASAVRSGTSKDRGHLLQLRFDYPFNKNINGYILVEYFKPGDFYVEKDSALFLRTEANFKF